jgi:hypothetical protein
MRRQRSLCKHAYDLQMPLVPANTHVRTAMNPEFGPWMHKDPPLPYDVSLVLPGSPRTWRRAVYRMAQFFKWEGGYDFTQYGYDGQEDDWAPAFVWHRGELDGERWSDTAFGACCFRWREWTDAPPGWALQWIWLHPYERSHGHLTAAWPFFRARFGDFLVEPPLSRAMKGFLAKQAAATPPASPETITPPTCMSGLCP